MSNIEISRHHQHLRPGSRPVSGLRLSAVARRAQAQQHEAQSAAHDSLPLMMLFFKQFGGMDAKF